MIDCSSEIRDFHDEQVMLQESDRERLRGHRDANQRRLKENLKAKKFPIPFKFVKQGSYAMRTQTQHPKNEFDIDDGAVFLKSDLIGQGGANKAALDARKMVCAALQDGSFKKAPEVRENCVRVFYGEGYHVDIPVYRADSKEAKKFELASVDWKDSDPTGVTSWFTKCLDAKRFPNDDDDHQMRRIIRLLKAFGASRDSWNMPSGFIMTVLVNEAFSAFDSREDRAFYNAIVQIKNRLSMSLVVKHPVVNETITKADADTDMTELKEKLAWAISELQVTRQAGCSKKAALKAWGKVFNVDFFDDKLKESSSQRSPFSITQSEPSVPVEKSGGGRFG